MELTLKNYATFLPKELQRLAEKNKVRECDETEKGHFVAYIDDANDSYDVSLTINSKAEITGHDCDCKNGKNFCRHKVALLTHIAGNKKIKQAVKKVKNEVNKSDALLDEADTETLKAWVRNLLAKNKDMELAFIHYFSAKKHTYTREETIQITNDAIKAVVKNKKNIDPTELKKIVELWESVHAPVTGNYFANVTDENAFLCFHELVECCIQFGAKIKTNSNKIIKYIETLLAAPVDILNNIYNEESWTMAVDYFLKYIPAGKNNVRMYYLFLLENLINISPEERRTKLIDMIVMQYKRIYTENIYNGVSYTMILFAIVERHRMLGRYGNVFKPLRYSNEYNLRLIDLLIENGNIALAEKYCREQIEANSKAEYNVQYFVRLRKIYALKNDDIRLANIIEMLLPFTFSFDDFLYVYDRMPESEEKKKWRGKILSKAKDNRRNRQAEDFCFRLADFEKRYTKMFEYVRYGSYENILRYFEQMANTDKAVLLSLIIDKADDYNFTSADDETEAAIFPQLLAALLNIYSENYLKATLKKAEGGKWYYGPNRFVRYMRKELMGEDK